MVLSRETITLIREVVLLLIREAADWVAGRVTAHETYGLLPGTCLAEEEEYDPDQDEYMYDEVDYSEY